ncbi:MAG: Na+-driven multidrug efflux pump [Ignavibacteria bacterium]|nr:MAG: Na+-driven multidrug efflux pump [Ignavibacteria bacterium]KAF0161759.1 MAG: Na+-driven multidrug efflux pump [Ignavibacteria bacterium]
MSIISKDHKYILQIALPAIAGLSTQMVVSLVDTALVGRLPDTEYVLAAMGIGVLATWAVVSLFSSLATGTHVLIARRYGENNFEECGKVLNTSVILTFLIGLAVSLLVVTSSHWIASFFAADDKVGFYAGEFLYYRFMGIPFFLVTVSYRGFFFGIGKTKIFMISGLLVNLLNIIFNIIFIYGAFGIKGMGLAGSGLGSTLATICDAAFYFCVSLLPSYRKKFRYFKNLKFVRGIAASIIKISLPVSLQNIFILIGFLSFISITGLIGTVEQAASNVVFSSLLISLLPCFGFGIAVHTLVGNSIGSGEIRNAKFLGFETSKLATIYTVAVGLFFVTAPRLVLAITTNDQNVIETAVPALRIAGLGQIFYGIGVVLANGLQASGATFFVMMAEVIVNWFIFVPIAYFLGVYLSLGLIGAWFALPFYVIIYAVVIFVKFRFGDWSKYKKV